MASDIEDENLEQKELEPVAESPKNFEEVVETLEAEAVGDVESIKETGKKDVSKIEESDGLPEDVGEMEEVAEKTTEEAKNEFKEAINSIPNWEDKQESLKEKPIDRNDLINNIKQTIEDYFSNVSLDDCQVLSGTAEYTKLLNYLSTREKDIEDSEKMKNMDTHQKIEYMQNLCGECIHKMANDAQVRDFLNKNGSNLSSGNNKLDEVIKSVFHIVEYPV